MKLEKDFKFKDIQYVRPDFTAMQKLAENSAEKIKNAVSYEKAKNIFLAFDKEESEFFDMTTVAYIRHTIDTSDEFYDKENEFINEKTPELMPSLLAFSNAVYSEESRFPKRIFRFYKKRQSFATSMKKSSRPPIFCLTGNILICTE